MRCPIIIKEAMNPYIKASLIGGGILGGTTFLSNLLMKQPSGKKMKMPQILKRTAMGTAGGAAIGPALLRGFRRPSTLGDNVGDIAASIGTAL